MEMLWKYPFKIDPSDNFRNLRRCAAPSIRRVARDIRMEPALADALERSENRRLVGRTVDNRGCAQPAELTIANVDGGSSDGWRLQYAARRITHHHVRQPKRRPVTFAAKRREEVCPAGPRGDERPNSVVDPLMSGIGIYAGKDDGAIVNLCQCAQQG